MTSKNINTQIVRISEPNDVNNDIDDDAFSNDFEELNINLSDDDILNYDDEYDYYDYDQDMDTDINYQFDPTIIDYSVHNRDLYSEILQFEEDEKMAKKISSEFQSTLTFDKNYDEYYDIGMYMKNNFGMKADKIYDKMEQFNYFIYQFIPTGSKIITVIQFWEEDGTIQVHTNDDLNYMSYKKIDIHLAATRICTIFQSTIMDEKLNIIEYIETNTDIKIINKSMSTFNITCTIYSYNYFDIIVVQNIDSGIINIQYNKITYAYDNNNIIDAIEMIKKLVIGIE
jgi:hypothetical protein